MPISAHDSIPSYWLYAEAMTDVELAFLHVETIPRRSSIHDWTIRAHAHPDHQQILLLTEGAVTVRLEEEVSQLAAPALVAASALTVHAFQFEPGSDGYVLTIAKPYFDAALEGDEDLVAAFSGVGLCIQGGLTNVAEVTEAFGALEREFVWTATGRRVAIKANLQRILVMISRLRHEGRPHEGGSRRVDADLVIRYRALIERAFRQQPKLAHFSGVLGVTPARLSSACRSVTGRPALTVMHERAHHRSQTPSFIHRDAGSGNWLVAGV